VTRPQKVTLSPGLDEWLRWAKDQSALQPKFRKVKKAIEFMREVGPSHRGFNTHDMKSVKWSGGQKIWNSYVENKTPGAWRMYWIYRNPGEIYILSVGPHDHDPGGPSG
jgi:hypothetical protein